MISPGRTRLGSAVALLMCLAAIPSLTRETGTLFVANHASGTVTIVDGSRRAVLGTLKIAPRPHGLAVLAR